jgi:TPR repeat protein
MSQEILSQIEKELDPENPHSAEQELRRGAEAGEAGAQYILGAKLIDEQDEAQQKQGLQWLRKSATQWYLPAAVKLSELYKDGKVVVADKEKSRLWMQVAAEGGFPEGQNKLAKKLLDSGTPSDQEGAIKWLMVAASLDSQTAALELVKLKEHVSPVVFTNGSQAAAEWLSVHPDAPHMKDGEYLYSTVIKVDSPLPD